MGIPINHPAIAQAVVRGLIAQARPEPVAALPPGLSEKAFQAEVVKLAEANGWQVYHTWDSRRSPAGFPDLVMLCGPALVFAELKVAKNTTTPAQEEWLEGLAKVPHVRVRRWRPEHWAEICAELTAEGSAA